MSDLEFMQDIYNICIKHGYVIEDLEKIITSKVYGNMDEVLNFKIVKYKPVPNFFKRIKNHLTK